MDKLKISYQELVTDISKTIGEIVNQIDIGFYKTTFYPEIGQNLDRYTNRKNIRGFQINLINREILTSSILRKIQNKPITEKIYNLLKTEENVYFKSEDFQTDLRTRPSITFNLIAGFITELILENENGIYFEPDIFGEKFSILCDFLENESITYQLLINLYGPYGSKEIDFNDSIHIKKATHEIAKLFSIHYPNSIPMELEMFENDYYIEINRSGSKKEIHKLFSDDYKTINTIFHTLLLSNTGNIEIGKSLRVSK